MAQKDNVTVPRVGLERTVTSVIRTTDLLDNATSVIWDSVGQTVMCVTQANSTPSSTHQHQVLTHSH